MESPSQQPESQTTNPPAANAALEPASMTTFSPTVQSVQKGKWIFTQVVVFLADLTKNIGQLWNQYKRLIITVALILAVIVALRLIFAVMDALNDIPLLAPTFEVIGVGYSLWFVNRYLLQESKRQELYQKLQQLLNQQQ